MLFSLFLYSLFLYSFFSFVRQLKRNIGVCCVTGKHDSYAKDHFVSCKSNILCWTINHGVNILIEYWALSHCWDPLIYLFLFFFCHCQFCNSSHISSITISFPLRLTLSVSAVLFFSIHPKGAFPLSHKFYVRTGVNFGTFVCVNKIGGNVWSGHVIKINIIIIIMLILVNPLHVSGSSLPSLHY